ncbi:hypothetical protein ACQJBY_004391 [Aegilops geniculata]
MGSGVGDRMATRCRTFAREAVRRLGAWAKPDPSKPRVPFRTRMERFNQEWDRHLTEGERSVHNFKRTMKIAGPTFTAAAALHIFYKEMMRVQGPDGAPAYPDTSYERARRAVFLFLHKVDPGSFPSPGDPALRLAQLWRTYYEELFGKPAEDEAENKEESLETARITAEAQALISQTLGKLQAEEACKTEADAVLFLVTKHRETWIREGALESLLDHQMHRVAAALPGASCDLSLLTEQRASCVRAAAVSSLRKQLRQRMTATARATEGPPDHSSDMLTLITARKMVGEAQSMVDAVRARWASEATRESKPGDGIEGIQARSTEVPQHVADILQGAAEAHAKRASEAARRSKHEDGAAGSA